jgi:hypothetical protein
MLPAHLVAFGMLATCVALTVLAAWTGMMFL